MNNEKYDYFKNLHPDWSDEQIWAAVSICLQAENEVDKRGEKVSPSDSDLIKAVLDGARKWLAEVLPSVFVKVSAFFDRLLSTISEWVQKGLTYAIDAIAYLLNRK